MPASNFSEVAGLPPAEQRKLLENGDGPERLWSAWAIALRLGRDALPMLRSLGSSDVPEGLRRHLLVVLAGMGERELLRTVADCEPAASVRAAATTLYLRTAPDRASADTVAFALRQLHTAPPEVRRAILGEQELGQASIPAKDLFPVLRDPDAAVRVACATCILKDPTGDTQSDAVRAVVEAFAREDDPDVRRELLSRLPRSAVPDVLNALRQSDAPRIVEALDTALARFRQLTWNDVKSIVSAAALEVTREILASGLEPDPREGAGWLCDVIRKTSTGDSSLARDVNRLARHGIRPLLTDAVVASLSPADRALLLTVFQEAQIECVAYIDEYGPDEDYPKELDRLVRVLGASR